jgi:hypothetical protein
MPAENVLDRLIGYLRFSPFKCRACRAKFYRRSNTVPDRPAPVESAPVLTVARCHRSVEDTMQRLDRLILAAGDRRLRRR